MVFLAITHCEELRYYGPFEEKEAQAHREEIRRVGAGARLRGPSHVRFTTTARYAAQLCRSSRACSACAPAFPQRLCALSSPQRPLADWCSQLHLFM